MLSQNQIQKMLQEKNVKILKSLGQNFLVSENILKQIIQAAELSKDDLAIEIGPGLGVLTEELSQGCRQVIAVEKDKKLAEMLEEKLSQAKTKNTNVEIITGDVLKINLNEKIRKYSPDKKYKFVANIPYYITSPVIRLFLESKFPPQVMVLLVQKEVAERICAKPGKLNVLALSVQIYGEPEIIGFVDKSSFYPEPQVDSAILRIRKIKKDVLSDDYQKIFKIIKIGFAAKRKKLCNNLSAGLCLDKNKAGALLQKAGISLNARAQELKLSDWKKLAENMIDKS